MIRRIAIVVVVLVLIGTGIWLYPLLTGGPKKAAGPATMKLESVVAVAGGFGHSLAITSDRTVRAWGRNESGQLGDGTAVDRDTARQIAGLRDIIAVAAGFDHSMALVADGIVLTWGSNERGQLGRDARQGSGPREVARLLQVQAIAAGSSHSFALKSDGTIWAWGANDAGQLGDETFTDRISARTIAGLTGAIAIASGRDHGAALRQDGTVWTWGANDEGQLGDGTKENRPLAGQVRGLTNVVAIACGYDFTLALRDDGTVWAWGANDEGQLGDGTREQRLRPTRSHIADVAAISAGRGHVVVLLKNGDLRGWGSNQHRQLASGSGAVRTAPVKIRGIKATATAIASGGYHVLAIMSDGSLRSWGHNKFGQLGNGSSDYQSDPVVVLALPPGASQPKLSDDRPVIMVAGGRSHSVVLKANGSVWAWGDNFSGQLGDGDRRTIRPFPQLVPGITRVTAIAAGSGHTLALRDDGTVWAWGNNEGRQLGDGTGAPSRAEPVQVASLTDVSAIAAGSVVSLAVKNDGTVWTWGVHPNSPAAKTTPFAPMQVAGLANISAVSAGDAHALALARDGSVWAWGDNMVGQLGDGSAITRSSPIRVSGLADVVAIAAGGKFSSAVKKDGTVWAWGLTRQLTSKDILAACDFVPAQVAGVQDAAAITAGEEHAVVLKRDGLLWGWGKNSQQQLGGMAGSFTSTLVAINGIANVATVAAGGYHNIAVLKDGKVLTWGYNEYGQTGNGSQGRIEHGSKQMNTGALGKRVPGPVNWPVPASAKVDAPSVHPEIKTLSAGGSHSALLMADGTVWTWGDDSGHQLGVRSDRTIDGKTVSAVFNKHRPFPVASLKDIQAIDAGWDHSLALKSDGTVVEWGRSYDDFAREQRSESRTLIERIEQERSLTPDRGRPKRAMNDAVGELTDVAAITAGGGFSLALKRDGTVWTWGTNKFGQLGDGTTTSRTVPRQVPGLTNVQALATGQSYVLALTPDGSVWAWGAVGRQGVAKHPLVLTKPVLIEGLSGVMAIAGGYNAFALKSDGTVWNLWQWDRNDPVRMIPSPVAGLTDVSAISAKSAHLLALINDGTVRMVRHPLPEAKDAGKAVGEIVEPVEEISDAVEVYAGGGHSIVVKQDGTMFIWGQNNAGQLGDATGIGSSMPLKFRFP